MGGYYNHSWLVLLSHAHRQIAGIMNGTTNFMLSAMETRGVDYGEILAEAQAKGFAEGT